MTLTPFNPTRRAGHDDDFFRTVDRFFNTPFFNRNVEHVSDETWRPAVDVSEDKDHFHITAELPGLSKDDLRVNVEDGLLSIEGERNFEEKQEGKDYHRVERRYGKFYRAFRLPKTVDANKINAKFKDGVLHLDIPKAEDAKPRQISISVK